jgi:tetratricopeptide (TPR) repeat protein
MIRRVATFVLTLAALAVSGTALGQSAAAPRDIWPQATTAALEGDVDQATKRVTELLSTGRTRGIRTYPLYASSAAALASASADKPDVLKWARTTADQLDPSSPAVAFSTAESAAKRSDWAGAVRATLQGLRRGLSDERTRVLTHADLLLVAAMATTVVVIFFAVALFFRYGRSMGHDFREFLGRRMTGGSISVIAFALLFLPLFLWLSPVWLIFYWFAIFFAYASVGERIAIVILLLITALLPIAVDATANRIAALESPVVLAAISSESQGYQPEALRRLQELAGVVPDHAMLQLLLGNMQAFEGQEEQATQHYRRAIELGRTYAGAHVNLGNLFFLNNEFQAALTEYTRAQQLAPELAIAYFNASVANGETYKFDQQAKMLEQARAADRSFVERVTRNQPPQKIVMYNPPISEAWGVADEMSRRPAARSLFGNYSTFEPLRSASTPITIGALAALLFGLVLWAMRRRSGLANACIKCGRTFCPRCKSARESTTYCTQCIHIYLKRDGVSLDTKRQKLEEVSDHHNAVVRRNRAFATFLPGAAQMLEGRTVTGILGAFSFALAVLVAVLLGRLAPALGPVGDASQNILRVVAILIALILWLFLSLPVYRRRIAV